MNPKKNNKLIINNPKTRISTKFSKRLELDHIEETIDTMSVIPDFGFDYYH